MHVSNVLENVLTDWLFRGLSGPFPFLNSQLYVALSTGTLTDTTTGATIVEPATFDYTRLSVSRDTASGGGSGFASSVNGTTHNLNDLAWTQANVDWGTINGIALLTAPTIGVLLFWQNIAAKPVNVGDMFVIPAGALTLQLD